MILLHIGGKPLNIHDPVDQIVIGCLCVALLPVIYPLMMCLMAAGKEKWNKSHNRDAQ